MDRLVTISKPPAVEHGAGCTAERDRRQDHVGVEDDSQGASSLPDDASVDPP